MSEPVKEEAKPQEQPKTESPSIIQTVKDAVGLAKEVVAPSQSSALMASSETPPPPPPKESKILLVSDTCRHCENIKLRLEQKGLLGKVKIVNVDTEEGRKLADENNVRGVPECLVILEKNGESSTRICTDDEFFQYVEQGE